jgi:serine phosphatase RsbU (regulator of sigma subunit)
MKGVFHSLIQMSLSADEWLVRANAALSACLEPTSFITATYFEIDVNKKQISFARAGHCPSLYYSASNRRTHYFKNKGLGLGILRNGEFKNHVEKQVVHYHSGDILTLYTDGIIEARNQQGEDFGYHRLQEAISQLGDKSPLEIKDNLVESFYAFCDGQKPDDDYTLLILKFK